MLTNTYPNILSAAGATAAAAAGAAAAAPLKCPRCNSTNTKFCYYNNYSLAQPRHFCKTCKRYWTRGGTLRDVPIGGGCRKNKRHKKPQSAAAAAAFSLRRPPNAPPPPASDLRSPIYGLPPTDSRNLFFPMFGETVESGIGGSHLVDNLHQSAPLLCYDDLPAEMCEGLGLIKENPIEADTAYLYSWPESCSSAVRLL